MFVHSKVNVTDKCPLTLMVLPLGSSSVDGWSHIPSPYGAALLPLPFGTGHETNIFSAFFYFFSLCRRNVAKEEIIHKIHHLSGLNGLFSLGDILQF
ncbi:hypothetical protein Patl1_22816 [Pistacia atlantica]|uniref:Uncharacterized protein n=1 Tax=Pistacia atlantica TaxID=434234 RepID=A0ACC1A1S3_9ROSI|nr:hypothetical protein Patl1_22816 [Pistacia atlantica]